MKLAVVGKIIATNPIDGADKIQSARVECGDAGTWTGVCGKHNLRIGFALLQSVWRDNIGCGVTRISPATYGATLIQCWKCTKCGWSMTA